MLHFQIMEDGSEQLYLLKWDDFHTCYMACYDHCPNMDLLHDAICEFGREFSENLLEEFCKFNDLDVSTFEDAKEWMNSAGSIVADDDDMYFGDMNGGARDEFLGEKFPLWVSLYNLLAVLRI